MIPAAIIVGLTVFAVGAAYLWFTDRDEKRAGYLKPSEPPSDKVLRLLPPLPAHWQAPKEERQ